MWSCSSTLSPTRFPSDYDSLACEMSIRKIVVSWGLPLNFLCFIDVIKFFFSSSAYDSSAFKTSSLLLLWVFPALSLGGRVLFGWKNHFPGKSSNFGDLGIVYLIHFLQSMQFFLTFSFFNWKMIKFCFLFFEHILLNSSNISFSEKLRFLVFLVIATMSGKSLSTTVPILFSWNLVKKKSTFLLVGWKMLFGINELGMQLDWTIPCNFLGGPRLLTWNVKKRHEPEHAILGVKTFQIFVWFFRVYVKMNKAWMGLEKAPEGTFKSKLHGYQILRGVFAACS